MIVHVSLFWALGMQAHKICGKLVSGKKMVSLLAAEQKKQ